MKCSQVKCHLKLLFCVILISFSQVLVGSAYVFSSTLFVELRKPSSKIKLNVDEESWIASVSVLVCPVGLLVMGVLTDIFGKRIALQIALIPMTLGWLFLSFADSYRTLLISRILLGFPLGVSSCMFLYIAEICPAELRSVYSAAVPMLVGVGMTAESVLSMCVDWRTACAAMCAAGAANFVALFAVPEPPMWLRSKGRGRRADEVDAWLGLRHVESAGVARTANADETENADRTTATETPCPLRPTVWKPAMITFAFFALQQCSGVYVMSFYYSDVLRSFRVPWDGVTVSAILSAARVLGTAGYAALHRLQRTTLVVVSGGAMAASLLAVVACDRASAGDRDQPPVAAASVVVALLAYTGASMLGILPIPWTLCGEVFPMAIKGVMNGIVQTFGYLFWFMVCKLYPLMVLKYGANIVLSAFAFFCILNVLFAIFIMPETKGKTLDEILSYFEPNKKVKKPIKL